MTKHNFRVSGYERRDKEQYYTEHWCTRAFLDCFADGCFTESSRVWDPAAGRGDILRPFSEIVSANFLASDIDTSKFDGSLCKISERDFFTIDPAKVKPVDLIITNPPYGGRVKYDGKSLFLADAFVRHALKFDAAYVAMLMRSGFKHGGTRTEALFENPRFYGEIVLTTRPRWDWWYEPEPGEERKGPMHDYSWYIWTQDANREHQMFWRNKADVGEKDDGNYESED